MKPLGGSEYLATQDPRRDHGTLGLSPAAGGLTGRAHEAGLDDSPARRDAEVAYGYGWFLRGVADGQVEQVSHTGSDGVFFSAFVWRPAEKIFYYMVTNAGEKAGAEVASRVLQKLREGTSRKP